MRREITTGDLVAFLSSPNAYPHDVATIGVRETHMSWVFLTDGLVYKLKKPVRFPFLDYSSLTARERCCREEIRLNRRLAPDVYLGVATITVESDGRLAVDGEGPTIDWLVKMRRLPSECMLDQAIKARTVTPAQIERVADVLLNFFREAERVHISPKAYLGIINRQHTENKIILHDKRINLPPNLAHGVAARLQRIISSTSGWIERPARSGHLVDGHGDLRPEHICLLDPPVIIDCLEFNQDLRLNDPLEELAFLRLECELLNARWIGDLILERYVADTGRPISADLLAFYTAFKACIRARLALAHLFDPVPRDAGKWEPLARAYLEIADRESLKLLPKADRQSSRFRGGGG